MITIREAITDLLKNDKAPKQLEVIYSLNPRLWIYALICGIGALINMIVLHTLISTFPLWLSNLIAILTAFGWNYINSLGRLRRFWGI